MSRDGNQVQVSFCPVPTPDVQADCISVGFTKAELHNTAGESVTTKGGEQGKRPRFGPQPKFDSKAFDFKQELEQLPFPVNIREVELALSQQRRFLELVFSLCDEDLGLCD